MTRRLRGGLRLRLLLSYLLVVGVALSAVAVGVRLIAPSLFDDILVQHLGRGRMAGAMDVAMRQATDSAFSSAMAESMLLAVFVATLAAVGVSLFVTARIAEPIRRVAAASQRIAHGESGVRAGAAGPDEIGDLAEGFNRMAEALEKAEQRRVELIGDVAHELRTPLATVRGNLEGLLDGVVQPSETLWAQLHGETSRMNRLVEDLQELSRVESGAVTIRADVLPVAELVEAAALAFEPRFQEKGVRLEVALPDRRSSVVADRDRTGQVLANLLGNALRYTTEGGSVRLSVQPAGESLCFQIQDSGVGIPSEHLGRVFDRFYRVDRSRSRAVGGSGIGLTIARALVEAQGGRIWAESAGAGQGSTFSFTLPLAR
ncbi:MAG TPA: ATP-binding protein [Thermomicrobiaceae bacterium]|nr:ATP-binding protein [Thermomicrobiaceae bacterium]